MPSKDWEFKGHVAWVYRQYAELWKRGWVKGPKTKKGKKGYYSRLVKKERKRW